MGILMNSSLRIKEERKRLDLTQDQLAGLLGVTKQSILAYEKGSRYPDLFFLEKASQLGFDTNYIITGKKVNNNIPRHNDNKDDIITIPLVEARLSAGGGSFLTSSEIEEYFYFSKSFIEQLGNPRNMVAMKVSGDSMEPEVYHNDIVIIDEAKKDIYPSRMYAVAFGECIYLKRIDRLPNQIVLKSSNPHYSPIIIDINEHTENQFK